MPRAWRFVAYRAWVVAAIVVTVWLTWPLWQARETPACLPLASLPACDYGVALVVAACLAIALPRLGAALYAAVLLAAILADQTRIQPQMISFGILLAGAIGTAGWCAIARAYLVSLWFYSGMHKLISPGFYGEITPWLWDGLFPNSRFDGATALGVLMARSELALAALCLPVATRRAAAGLAAALHVGVLVVLSPVGVNWNTSVWPWNAVLAVSGWMFFADWREPLLVAWRGAGRGVRACAIALALVPAGFYLGLVDAYLAHCVYSGNAPAGYSVNPLSRHDLGDTWADLNVPLPPAIRLYRQAFLAQDDHGEWLEIDDPRWIARLRGQAKQKLRRTEDGRRVERFD